MRRDIISIVSGVVAAVLTGTAAWSFLMAASWSFIHGGMGGMTLAVLSLVAMAVPPGCGYLAAQAIHRWWPERSAIEMAEPGAIQMTDPIRLNCPHCGSCMKPSARYAATPAYRVVECPIHGPFHFGPNTNLTLGPPPQT